jgi:hypothetical protein
MIVCDFEQGTNFVPARTREWQTNVKPKPDLFWLSSPVARSNQNICKTAVMNLVG